MARLFTYFRSRLKSFKYAFQGIRTLFSSQPNARIHLLAMLVITAMGLYFRISRHEWCELIICMALVLSMETVNTAIEFIVDLVSPDYHPLAGKAKDVAAAAVLLSVLVCGFVWGIIFLPKMWA